MAWGGREAAEKILAMDKDAALVVSSGYSSDPVMAEYQKYGFRAAVAKPFDMNALRRAMVSVLQ